MEFLSKEEIFQMEKNEFIETITMNCILYKIIQNIYFKQLNHNSFQKKMIHQLDTNFKKHYYIQYELLHLMITIGLLYLLFIQLIKIIYLNKVVYYISILYHHFKVT